MRFLGLLLRRKLVRVAILKELPTGHWRNADIASVDRLQPFWRDETRMGASVQKGRLLRGGNIERMLLLLNFCCAEFPHIFCQPSTAFGLNCEDEIVLQGNIFRVHS